MGHNARRDIGNRLAGGETAGFPTPDRRRGNGRRQPLPQAGPPDGSEGAPAYAELHCHTAYSFDDGASHSLELLTRARDLGLHALAITDHNNLCGAMEFAQTARSVGVRPLVGVELTLSHGAHITLLGGSGEGHSNICRLVTRAHIDAEDRLRPGLDESLLAEHAEGVICLSGCRDSDLARAVDAGETDRAREIALRYRDWFGDRYHIELGHNFAPGDHERVRAMAELARDLDIPPVATGNVHYHVPERHRLHEVRQAIGRNQSLDQAERYLRPNDQFHLRPPEKMRAVFRFCPEAVENTVRVADRCDFDLASSRLYGFPQYPAPEGHDAPSWLRTLCEDAAIRRYGGLTPKVRERLDRELELLERHDLCGFMLQYHEIIRMARGIQEELGLVERGRPIEDNPPGRGRGSSVAMLVGYLVGLSHIDPLEFDLRLERFMSDEMSGPPDIDLDFPRDIREQLILRVHELWGYEHAALTGMITTYRLKGAVRDAGKALGLPEDDLDRLAKSLDGYHRGLEAEMADLLVSADSHLWRELALLVEEMLGMPRGLAQHPGGMVLSARPLSETVPLQRGAMDGRYIIQWDRDSADDAGFVKIDFLALGALSQMNEALELICTRHETPVDLSRIDFDDPEVYGMLHRADTIGVFQVESAAQMQTLPRLRPRNLTEMAWEVGCVRPGVGVNDGVTRIIARHTGKEPDWDYDHPLERPALERTYGVPLYQ
ncbi:MAG: PHP domain-containing protein, partial [Chloroflexota bacterium]